MAKAWMAVAKFQRARRISELRRELRDLLGPQTVGTIAGGDTGEDEIAPGEVIYGWNAYNECWQGVDQNGRTVYVPDEGIGELPGCPDDSLPTTEPR